jgi:hypothetical protein
VGSAPVRTQKGRVRATPAARSTPFADVALSAPVDCYGQLVSDKGSNVVLISSNRFWAIRVTVGAKLLSASRAAHVPEQEGKRSCRLA